MNKKSILGFIFFLAFSLSSFALHTSTNSFNKRIDNHEGYKEIIFYNNSTLPKTYGFKILPSKKNDSMHQWTHLSDSTITIPPLDSYTLKIFSKSPENTPKGQYECILQITPVILPKTNYKKRVVLPLIVNFGVQGYVGKLDYENFSINKDFNLNNNIVSGDIQNNCFANIETSVRILNASNKMLFDEYIGVIKKGNAFKVQFKIPEYVNKKDIKYIEFYNYNNSEIIQKIPLIITQKG